MFSVHKNPSSILPFAKKKNKPLIVNYKIIMMIAGSEVVLGPNSLSQNISSVPLEQAVTRQRLRPGSGFLTVKVLTDGPTRVIQITDVKDGVSNQHLTINYILYF